MTLDRNKKTALSQFEDDLGLLPSASVPSWALQPTKPTYSYSEIMGKPTLFSGNYNDLINKPVIPSVPSWALQASKPSYAYSEITGLPTLFSGNYSDLIGKPTLFDGNYNSLTNKPTIPAVPSWALQASKPSYAYSEITGLPTLFSGNYSDLIGKPTLFDGNYNSLTNKPTIPAVPSWALQASKPTYDYSELTGRPTLFDGNYNSLTNKPTIPAVPSWALQASKPTYTASEVGADASGTASSAIAAHLSAYNHANIATAYNWVANYGYSDYVRTGSLSSYLPLSGGTMTGTQYFPYNKASLRLNSATGGYGAFIDYDTNGSECMGFGVDYSGSSFRFKTGIAASSVAGGSFMNITPDFEIKTGVAYVAGNSVIHSGNIGSQYAGYANRVVNDSSPMAFHWLGLGGQPSWLWGGNTATDMYVYNPSNFSVYSAGVLSDGVSRYVSPIGGSFTTQSSTYTGAIKIKLPASKHNSATMLRMTIKIYQYDTGKSLTFNVGGYNYSGGSWYNVFAEQISDANSNQFTVRFGDDGTRDCIWIGELNSSWTYPQIFITNVQCGYGNTDNGWATDWNISFVSSFDTVEITRNSSVAITSNNIGSQGVNYADHSKFLTGADAFTNGTDGWWRSYGNCGWFNQTYSVGIYATDSDYVRTYNNAGFIASTISATGELKSNYALNLVYAPCTNVATVLGNWAGAGIWGFGNDSTAGGHVLRFDQVYGQSFVGASDITLKLGTKTVLDSSNWSSYCAAASHTHDYATHRGEGTNYVDYSRYVYNNGAYSGSGWVEPSDLGVRYAASAGNASTVGGYSASQLMSSGSTYDYMHSFVQNGYQKLANGLIIQWGRNYVNAIVCFPIEFPNSCVAISACNISNNNTEACTCSSVTPSTFYLNQYGKSNQAMWFAIGF